MPSDNDRYNNMVNTMVPATRNRNARYLTLRFAFYPDGHASFNAVDRPDMCINSSTDTLLVAALAMLINKARRRVQAEQDEPAVEVNVGDLDNALRNFGIEPLS